MSNLHIDIQSGGNNAYDVRLFYYQVLIDTKKHTVLKDDELRKKWMMKRNEYNNLLLATFSPFNMN